jgi:hypothetical protein
MRKIGLLSKKVKRVKRALSKAKIALTKPAIKHASKKEVMAAYLKVSHKLEASSRYLADH